MRSAQGAIKQIVRHFASTALLALTMAPASAILINCT